MLTRKGDRPWHVCEPALRFRPRRPDREAVPASSLPVSEWGPVPASVHGGPRGHDHCPWHLVDPQGVRRGHGRSGDLSAVGRDPCHDLRHGHPAFRSDRDARRGAASPPRQILRQVGLWHPRDRLFRLSMRDGIFRRDQFLDWKDLQGHWVRRSSDGESH